MSAIYKKPALILHGIVLTTYPYNEHDLRLVVLSEEGEILSINRVRGQSQKKGIRLESFDSGRFSINSRAGGALSLKEFQPTTSWAALRQDLNRLTCALFLVELLLTLAPQGAPSDPDLYTLFSQALQQLAQQNELKLILKELYFSTAALLENLGYLDSRGLPAPSRNSLFQLIQHAEAQAGKTLKVKEELRRICMSL